MSNAVRVSIQLSTDLGADLRGAFVEVPLTAINPERLDEALGAGIRAFLDAQRDLGGSANE